MQADVVDVDRVTTGAERTGLYFAIWGMGTKLALALAVGIALPTLAAIGFQAESGQNSPGSLLVLALLYGLLPVPFKLASTWLVWNFPLTEAAQRSLRG